MRRHDDLHPHAGKTAQQGLRQRGPFARICRRDRLVEQDQRTAYAMLAFKQPDHVRHVCGEARQVAGEVLRISDVRKQLREHRHFGFRLARQQHAGSDHESKEAHDFQRDGFSARIRSG